MFTTKSCLKKIYGLHLPELINSVPIRFENILFDTGLYVDYNYKMIIDLGHHYESIVILFNQKMSCELYDVFGYDKYNKKVDVIFCNEVDDVLEVDLFYMKISFDDILMKYIKTYFKFDNYTNNTYFVYFSTNMIKTKNIIEYLEVKDVC